jgi:neurofibromin 1
MFFQLCVVFRIVTQPRLPWWPQIDLVYNKSSELRSMFTDTLNKVTQGCISSTPLRMIQVQKYPPMSFQILNVYPSL